MNFLILSKDFKTLGMVDKYISMIWTDRYRGYGDFEIYGAVATELFKDLKRGQYLWNRDSDRLMIIERLLIETDTEEGDHITVSGRSLESLLERRIIWKQTRIRGNFQNGIKKLINENVINPTDSKRKIDNFVFVESTDPRITELTMSAQFTGNNLYETIIELCEMHDLGFQITLNDDTNNMEFRLYKGVDRTYEQTENSFVIFSPEFDNLLSTNYLENSLDYKNVVLVMGEEHGDSRRNITLGTRSGIERREMYVDARDLQSEEADGTIMPEEEYHEMLEVRGTAKQADHKDIIIFEGEVSPLSMFVFGTHYFLGDYVQIVNEYGREGQARVDEIILADDLANGQTHIPSFTRVEDDE